MPGEPGQTSVILMRVHRDSRELVQRIKKLHEIAVALSAERDIRKLLTLILTESRRITNADGGSMFVREDLRVENKGATGKDEIYKLVPFLSLKVAQNDSVSFPFSEMRLPFDHRSIAGHAAISGELLNLPDVYRLPRGAPYSFSTDFDKATGYRCKSMLVMPMRNRDGETIGVLQLINKKKAPDAKLDRLDEVDRMVLPFDGVDEELISSLASQAAVCVEKATLYDDITRMFAGLVESLTIALEKRNRTTYGHSMRVAKYADAIARAMLEEKEGPFAKVMFTHDELQEIYYAGLLHDIGKLAVPEAILDKQNKLIDDRMALIEYRFAFAAAREPARAAKLKEDCAFIKRINVPRERMSPDDQARLKAIGVETFQDFNGERQPLLTAFEVENLEITRGNLTKGERKMIEQHIVDTWEILRRIPWPKHLRHVANLAACHHEKVDGSGYPWGLKGADIPLGGKILAMVDIYEALTAKDRPYKPAMPIEQALGIVKSEVEGGKLDAEIFKLFTARNLHRLFSDETGYVRPRPEEGSKEGS